MKRQNKDQKEQDVAEIPISGSNFPYCSFGPLFCLALYALGSFIRKIFEYCLKFFAFFKAIFKIKYVLFKVFRKSYRIC